MVVPWQLVWRLAAALAAGVVALGLRGARRPRISAAFDLTLTLALGAVVGGRLAVLAIDAALLGALPEPRALSTLGPGLSVPGALIGAAVAGWRRRGNSETWVDTAVAVTIGVAAFSAAHLPAGTVPNAVRVGLLVAAAVWITNARSWHPGPRLVVALAGTHLVTSAVGPSLPTIDTDLDTVLTAAVLAGALLTHPRVAPAARRLSILAAVIVAAVALIGVFTGRPLELPIAATTDDVDLVGAIQAGAPTDATTPVPAWGGADLAALTAGSDLPVVVNLWASWCPPCHAEAPTVARAARALEGRALVLGVLVDDDADSGQAFADQYGLTFPTVLDDGLSDAVGMAGLPTTVVLAPDGTVIQRVVGGLSQATLAAAVAEATPAG